MVETQKGLGDEMKKYKSMIILLAVFVVFFALYFVMGKVNEYQATKDIEETIMVTDFDSLVSLEYSDGATTMSFVKEDDAWVWAGEEEITLDSDSVETIANVLSQVEAVRVLEGADELSSYGLEKPVYTITMENEAGTTLTLYIGDVVDDNYYATTNDKVVVYTIGSSAVTNMEFDITVLEAEEEEETEETTDESTEETTEETTE